MAKTYLDIVNIVLQDANEVPVSQAAFSNVRGLQAFIKEAVNRALMDINTSGTQWEWLKEGTVKNPISVSTVDGTQFYDFRDLGVASAPYVDVDFDTFFIGDGSTFRKPLLSISYDHWNDLYRANDELNTDSKGIPNYIIVTGEKNVFGLSPVPDGAYTVNFHAWSDASFLVNHDDELPFPDQYYTVLVDRARHYLWDFKENETKAAKANNAFKRGLKQMQQQLAPMRDTRMRVR